MENSYRRYDTARETLVDKYAGTTNVRSPISLAMTHTLFVTRIRNEYKPEQTSCPVLPTVRF